MLLNKALFTDGKPHPSLIQLFSILDIAHEGTFASMVDQGQRYLLRSKDVERWQLDKSSWENKKSAIIKLLSELGFITAVEPKPGIYDYAVIFGFVTIDVQLQRDFLIDMIKKQSIEIKQLIILTSALPLPTELYPDLTFGTTERQMMQTVFNHPALHHIQQQIIEVPMQEVNRIQKRPTTDDTVIAWRTINPNPGRCLAVSAQPFIRRQTKILQTLMPDSFTIIPCGMAIDDQEPLIFYLDELARALYQEQIYNWIQ